MGPYEPEDKYKVLDHGVAPKHWEANVTVPTCDAIKQPPRTGPTLTGRRLQEEDQGMYMYRNATTTLRRSKSPGCACFA